jgi:integrase
MAKLEHPSNVFLLTVQEKAIRYTVGYGQAKFIRMKSTSKKRTPSIVNLTVKRRYLTQREIDRLMDCARRHGRYGHRDATMILVAYRHGLRASEVCDLQWQQIDLRGPLARSPGQERHSQRAPNPR